MIPPHTLRFAVITFALVLAWLWAWLWLDWEFQIAPPPPPAVSTVVPLTVPDPRAQTSEIDSYALLQNPAFYPDRRPHGFRPDAKGENPTPPPHMDFELTTTVVGQSRAFAMLRLPGSNQSVVARAGEPFEADPAWNVTKIEKNSVSLVSHQGQQVTLHIKAPMPAQLPTSMPPPMPSPPRSAGTTSTAQAAVAPPLTAVQPSQGDADLRVRIEARRRDAEARARAIRTQ